MIGQAASGTIVFRADAGRKIGQGHIMRCLTLADALRSAGFSSRFICRAHEGHLARRIEDEGFPVALLATDPEFLKREGYEAWRGGSMAEEIALSAAAIQAGGGADLLVVDHYGLGAEFERALRPLVGRIAVFDDLHDRRRDCDLLIDQNIGHSPDLFAGLVPEGAVLLTGGDHAPLRPDFANLRESSLARRRASGRPREILVAMGGFDQLNVTGQILRALDPSENLGLDWVDSAHVVLGSAAPHLDEARFLAAALGRVALHVDSRDMPALMAQADLAIGGSGVTAIERCVMGLPTLIAVMAENQEDSARRLEAAGATITLGRGEEIDSRRVAEALNLIYGDPARHHAMIEAAAGLSDGRGLSRIAPQVAALAGRRPFPPIA